MLKSKQEEARQKKEREKNLFEAMLMLRDKEECAAFFTDLCTPSELQAMADRWLVARLLYDDKKSYRQIHEETGISLVTIGRVARFLTQESYQGYRLVLQRAKNLALDRH
jgi:TrpR-related protein YerC/YecD